MDIDDRQGLGKKLRFAGFCAYVAAVVYVFLRVSPILGVLMLPLVARWASRYLVSAVFDEGACWLRSWKYRGWHGAYWEFDGSQLRIDDFGRDMRRMPLIAVQDLEKLFKDRGRFQIKLPLLPVSGLLEGIPSVPADRALSWARAIARTSNSQADRALRLALFIERSLVEPREREKRLDGVTAFEADK